MRLFSQKAFKKPIKITVKHNKERAVEQYDLQVTPSAASQLTALLSSDATGEAMVVVIVAEVPSHLPALEVEPGCDPVVLEQSIARGREFLASLHGPIVHRWAIGCAPRSRFPPGDIRMINGIPFYLPHDMLERTAGRVLDVREDTLCFEPELDPLVTEK